MQDLVRFSSDQNSLVFEPQLYHEIRLHGLRLEASFVDYPSISRTEYFTAEVTQCVPFIDVSDAQAILDS